MVEGACLTDADIPALSDDELLRLYSTVMGAMMTRHPNRHAERWVADGD